MALLRVGGLNPGKRREELLQSYEGEEPYMPGGYETPYDGEEPYMPDGYDDEPYGDEYDDGYGDDYGYDDGYGDSSRYDDDYGYDEAYGDYEGDYAGDGDYDGDPYYDDPDYDRGPDYPENGIGDLLAYVDEHEWINWVLLALVPPLGIWMLWRRRRFSQNANILLTLAALMWMLAVIVLLFVRPFRAKPDTTITPQPIGAAALPTEAPPEETPVPEAEQADVLTAEEVDDANAVFAVADTPYYHQSESCSFIPSGAATTRIARNTAVEKSMLPCPYCMAGQYSDGLWDLVFVNADMEDRSNMKVYVSAYNAFFHTDPTCSDLGDDARQVGLKEALLMSKTACETCCPDAGRMVYCTLDGTYYHVKDDCSGMRNASNVTYAEARVTGKKRCPTCIGGVDETEIEQAEEESPEVAAAAGYYVYATPGGTYYHVNSTCSGMRDAKQVLLSDMLKEKRPACPVCCPDAETTVFAESGNPYYHSYATCSGMTNATQGILVNALAAGLKQCPVCWTKTDGK